MTYNNVDANLEKLTAFRELYHSCGDDVMVQYSVHKDYFQVKLITGMVVLSNAQSPFATKFDIESIFEFGRSLKTKVECVFKFPKIISDSSDLVALSDFCSDELLDYKEKNCDSKDWDFYEALADIAIWVRC